MAVTRTLVLGGQRSGKSRYAEQLVTASGYAPVYLATGTAGDGEMAERIAAHRQRRGGGWRTVEVPLDLPGTLIREAHSDAVVLVDCLTLWLTNLMAAERNIDDESAGLVAALGRVRGTVVIVTNEVGSGIIPANALARRYADALGTLNQQVAAAVDRVVFVAAGLPLVLKPQIVEAPR
jgi:adenosylcobinamide kinase / adenosylcobinamide-phosphate guanylyltransferase